MLTRGSSFLTAAVLGSGVATAITIAGAATQSQTTAAKAGVNAEVRISAGPLARRNTPVSFPLPGASNGTTYGLSGAGGTLPVQISDGVCRITG